MKVSTIRAAWTVAASAAAAVVLGVAADRNARIGRFDELIGMAAENRLEATEMAERVDAVLARELARSRPSADAVALTLAVARPIGRAGRVQALVEQWAAERLLAELARHQPREAPLRDTYDILVASGSPAATSWLTTIATAGGSRVGDVAALEDATAVLRRATHTPDADAAYLDLLAVRRGILGRPGTTWAARLRPPLAAALVSAEDALLEHLARATGDASQLRVQWNAAAQAGLSARLPPAVIQRLAVAMRYASVPAAGIAVGLGVALSLAGALVAVVALLRRGPKAIDPSAETIENVEPIDVDTDAVTLQRTTTGAGEDPNTSLRG